MEITISDKGIEFESNLYFSVESAKTIKEAKEIYLSHISYLIDEATAVLIERLK